MTDGSFEIQFSKLIYAAVPILILFVISVISATVIQEWVRNRWRNGKGDRRNGDQNVMTKILISLTRIEQKMDQLSTALTNDLHHLIDKIKGPE